MDMSGQLHDSLHLYAVGCFEEKNFLFLPGFQRRVLGLPVGGQVTILTDLFLLLILFGQLTKPGMGKITNGKPFGILLLYFFCSSSFHSLHFFICTLFSFIYFLCLITSFLD